MQKSYFNSLKIPSCIFILFFLFSDLFAQELVIPKKTISQVSKKSATPVVRSIAGTDGDLFGTGTRYIKNIGQYGNTLPNYIYMGNILYGYEGLNMPVLFTKKGMIHLQRKIKKLSNKEIEWLERKGMGEEEINKKNIPLNRVITMEWVNANPNPKIVTEGLTDNYYTYGILKDKARAFKKIIYKEIYPGIDLVYSFSKTAVHGYEYSFIIKPGADISLIKMKFGGDVFKIKIDNADKLIISSDIDDIIHSAPVCYYNDNKNKKIKVSFDLTNNEAGFKIDESYNSSKSLVIDPFVTSTGNLTGQYSAIAKDIDFDYQGNVYVSGGGDGAAQKMAKFDAAGLLKWTFTGSLSLPFWNFGGSEGGWVVEKITGSIYLGQGLAGAGFSVIRLNTLGVYDNYITAANTNFTENWKMLWNCNGGVPKILIAGGGGSANNELAILTPPNINPVASNISGLSGGHNDISDIIIDPVTNDMYTAFSISVLTPNDDSKIYKHTPPYTPASNAWNSFSGYFALKEPFNRPYLSGGLDNSSNCLALNNDYLFYWDGKNLKAFTKSAGNAAGTPVTLSGNSLMQGGIFADECNNVFVGFTNGTIKVYKFNGSVFDDAAAADINITGFGANSIYDIAYNHGNNQIYACGGGFLASFDVSQYCALPVYTVSVISDITALSATASLTPAPSAGSTVTFSLYDGTILINSNTTGVFTGLSLGINYTVKAIINEACSGTQAIKDFTLTATAPPAKAGIYVPNAFTPNGNGLNDLLNIIVYGIKEIRYFTIYNRYGQVVFTTKDASKGWDGKFRDKIQNTGTFIWMAEAVDLSGNIIRQKGTITLIR